MEIKNMIKNYKIIVLGGLPASGKSTFANQLKDEFGYNILSPDDIKYNLAKIDNNLDKYESELVDILPKYNKKAWETITFNLIDNIKNNVKTVIDNTFTTKKSRKQILNITKKFKVPTLMIYLDCMPNISIRRNNQRRNTIITYRNNIPIYKKSVSDEVIQNMYIKQELPSLDEGFDNIYCINIEAKKNEHKEYIKELLYGLYKSNNLYNDLEILYNNKKLKEYIPLLDMIWEYDVAIKDCLIENAIKLQNKDFEYFIAGLLEDVGKVFTRKKFAKIIMPNDNIFKEGDRVEVIKQEDKFINIKKGDITAVYPCNFLNIDDKYCYYNHENVSAHLVKRYLYELDFDNDLINKVYSLILNS